MAEFELPFPVKGIDKSVSFTRQPPLTTRDALNMRATDPTDMRVKGAQREGLSKFCAAQLTNAPVRNVTMVAYDSTHIDWAVSYDGHAGVWETNDNDIFVRDIAVDKYGVTYIVGGNSLLKFSAEGVLLERININVEASQETTTRPRFSHVAINDLGGIWIGCQTETTMDTTKYNNYHYTIYHFQETDAGMEFRYRTLGGQEIGYSGSAATDEVAWSVEGMQYINGRLFVMLYGRGAMAQGTVTEDDVWVVGWNNPTGSVPLYFLPTDPFNTGGSSTTTNQIPVFAVQIGDIADSNSPLRQTVQYSDLTTETVVMAPTCIDFNSQGEFIVTAWYRSAKNVPRSAFSGVVMFTASGEEYDSYWNIDGRNSVLTNAANNGGMVSCCQWRTSDEFIAAGAPVDYLKDGYTMRRFSVNRTLETISFDNGLSHLAGNNTYRLPTEGLAVGGTQYLYAVHATTDAYENVFMPLITYATPGSTSYIYLVDSTSFNWLNDAIDHPCGVGLPPTNPDYQDASITRPEYIICLSVGAVPGVSGTGIVAIKSQLVASTLVSGSPRTITYVGVADGNVYSFDSTSASIPTEGTGALSTAAQFIDSAVFRDEVFFTDGTTYRVYRPREDRVYEWTAETDGLMPRDCRLVAQWRNRLVLARDSEDPYNWYMSAVDDPYNWNYYPSVVTSTQAVAGNSADLGGPMPDIVNALIPYNDDLLLVGGDSSIYRITGDPMAGGYLDLISDQTGVAFGKAWAKDPYGAVYFFGTKGSVYRMTPSGKMEDLGAGIPDDLEDVDLSTYAVRLIWDYEMDGLRVLITPYGSGGTLLTHYFWERTLGAWWKDQYGTSVNTNRQPFSVATFDGDDPDDRVTVFGCEDGYVRKCDLTAVNDDQVAIDSYVVMGPMIYGDEATEVRFTRLLPVLSRSSGGCEFYSYVSDQPDAIPSVARRSGTLLPGRSNGKDIRSKGYSFWLRLRNARLSERWGVESLTVQGYKAGRLRARK